MSQILLDMLAKKTEPYSDEHEFRVIFDTLTFDEKWAPNLVAGHLNTALESPEDGLFVSMDLDALVEEVVVQPNADTHFSESISAMVGNFAPELQARIRPSIIP